MDGRFYHESLRRLRLFAGEADLTPRKVSDIVQPFINEWRTVPVPNLKHAEPSMDPDLQLSTPALTDLTARIRAIGMNLHRTGRKGIYFHNAFVRQVAALADTFDCRGWTESRAMFEDPAGAAQDAQTPPIQLTGRVDVIWARRRLPVAVFEIDSTIKERSFQKLKEAAAPHRIWIYFGKDIWGFRTFLQQRDPNREVLPIIVPQTFIPSFSDDEKH